MNKLARALSILVVILSGCGPQQTYELADLSKQKNRSELCGAELYQARESRQCGTIYRKQRARQCGVERYKQKKSRACPGYVAPDRYDPKGRDCKSGYSRRHRTYYRTQSGGQGEGNIHRMTATYCDRKEVIKTCRRKDHGVDLYKSCRHSVNGIEKYKTCRHPSFGVEKYKQCEFYKTPEQALAYAELIEADIPMMRDHMLIHKGTYYALQNSELAMGCHIKQYESSVLAQDAIASLKTKYAAVFGREYLPSTFECEPASDTILIAQCRDGDISPLCRSLYGYQTTVKWFEETNHDLGLIIADLTKFGQTKIVAALTTVAQYLKDPHNPTAAEAGAEQE